MFHATLQQTACVFAGEPSVCDVSVYVNCSKERLGKVLIFVGHHLHPLKTDIFIDLLTILRSLVGEILAHYWAKFCS